MKIKYNLIVLSFFLITTQFSQAQFFKKLQKRVEEKVENVIIDKAADKAAQKASKSMDKVLDVNPFGGVRGEKGNPEAVADTYEFSWKYSLKMMSKQGDMIFDYYLEPNKPYFGFTTNSAGASNMFTVMDTEKQIMAMFMGSEGGNVGIVSAMPSDLDDDEGSQSMEDYTFEMLPNKTINGYDCKGIKAISNEYEMIMYLTTDTEVSFSDIYKNGNTKIPVKLQDYFDPEDKVLMISMNMTSLKNKKYDMTMECVGLEKVSKTVNKSDYTFL